MQGNQKLEKFKKVNRTLIEGSDSEATITRGKKFNKPKRGGGAKGLFHSARESQVNQCNINGVY